MAESDGLAVNYSSLCYIFGNLRLRDLRAASIVCKYWNNAVRLLVPLLSSRELEEYILAAENVAAIHKLFDYIRPCDELFHYATGKKTTLIGMLIYHAHRNMRLCLSPIIAEISGGNLILQHEIQKRVKKVYEFLLETYVAEGKLSAIQIQIAKWIDNQCNFYAENKTKSILYRLIAHCINNLDYCTFREFTPNARDSRRHSAEPRPLYGCFEPWEMLRGVYLEGLRAHGFVEKLIGALSTSTNISECRQELTKERVIFWLEIMYNVCSLSEPAYCFIERIELCAHIRRDEFREIMRIWLPLHFDNPHTFDLYPVFNLLPAQSDIDIDSDTPDSTPEFSCFTLQDAMLVLEDSGFNFIPLSRAHPIIGTIEKFISQDIINQMKSNYIKRDSPYFLAALEFIGRNMQFLAPECEISRCMLLRDFEMIIFIFDYLGIEFSMNDIASEIIEKLEPNSANSAAQITVSARLRDKFDAAYAAAISRSKK
ncbi:MAG: F-box protein [Methylomonas sp.]|jgi:hypothetical protein|uniref:F-box protein n=1 Tax=Methylomonas sp. TaxID=418 RepID=UPI0025F6C108|nr:F-box protein [Methylomonas sp.]MCK9608154.1 F-box protein [Methylomonas sp.]